MTRQYIDDYLSDNQIQVKESIDISSMDLLIDFARIGVGVACVIKSFVKEDLASGALGSKRCPASGRKQNNVCSAGC